MLHRVTSLERGCEARPFVARKHASEDRPAIRTCRPPSDRQGLGGLQGYRAEAAAGDAASAAVHVSTSPPSTRQRGRDRDRLRLRAHCVSRFNKDHLDAEATNDSSVPHVREQLSCLGDCLLSSEPHSARAGPGGHVRNIREGLRNSRASTANTVAQTVRVHGPRNAAHGPKCTGMERHGGWT